MSTVKEGDIVTRRSYNCDIFFKVIKIIKDNPGKNLARLKGLDLRLEATALIEDLEKADNLKVSRYLHACQLKNMERMKVVFSRREDDMRRSLVRAIKDYSDEVEGFHLPGTLVHIDGDKDYMAMCMTSYKQLGIECNGYHIDEEKQAEKVVGILDKHRPDMLVLTGHDGLLKGAKKKDYKDINKYHHSKHFVNAVTEARKYEKSRDDLVIFAGACQSHYEALLFAGANFASSPKRVLIHAYDPVFVMEKVAYTSIYEPIALRDIIAGTITGFDGIGGLEIYRTQFVYYSISIILVFMGILFNSMKYLVRRAICREGLNGSTQARATALLNQMTEMMFLYIFRLLVEKGLSPLMKVRRLSLM